MTTKRLMESFGESSGYPLSLVAKLYIAFLKIASWGKAGKKQESEKRKKNIRMESSGRGLPIYASYMGIPNFPPYYLYRREVESWKLELWF